MPAADAAGFVVFDNQGASKSCGRKNVPFPEISPTYKLLQAKCLRKAVESRVQQLPPCLDFARRPRNFPAV